MGARCFYPSSSFESEHSNNKSYETNRSDDESMTWDDISSSSSFERHSEDSATSVSSLGEEENTTPKLSHFPSLHEQQQQHGYAESFHSGRSNDEEIPPNHLPSPRWLEQQHHKQFPHQTFPFPQLLEKIFPKDADIEAQILSPGALNHLNSLPFQPGPDVSIHHAYRIANYFPNTTPRGQKYDHPIPKTASLPKEVKEKRYTSTEQYRQHHQNPPEKEEENDPRSGDCCIWFLPHSCSKRFWGERYTYNCPCCLTQKCRFQSVPDVSEKGDITDLRLKAGGSCIDWIPGHKKRCGYRKEKEKEKAGFKILPCMVRDLRVRVGARLREEIEGEGEKEWMELREKGRR
ncbi:hypothetical protein EJ08DRAFT_233147 [Tothia fuscella]|uniref:Uncharacterized protein n=1 Tax=Tothia fuscella TaxID=1048955 RepID=A0A9P4U3T6_9PEZI|nr:hypothetical protein EJ08DRAFT_233147 [Tothia fuscella]